MRFNLPQLSTRKVPCIRWLPRILPHILPQYFHDWLIYRLICFFGFFFPPQVSLLTLLGSWGAAFLNPNTHACNLSHQPSVYDWPEVPRSGFSCDQTGSCCPPVSGGHGCSATSSLKEEQRTSPEVFSLPLIGFWQDVVVQIAAVPRFPSGSSQC